MSTTLFKENNSTNDYSWDSEAKLMEVDSTTSNLSVYSPSKKLAYQDSALPKRVIRKINGFLLRDITDVDTEAEVCFVINDKTIEYSVPPESLMKNNIKNEGQPFEYIETEIYDREEKIWSLNTKYIPACKAEEFDRIPIKLDDETRERLNMILRYDA